MGILHDRTIENLLYFRQGLESSGMEKPISRRSICEMSILGDPAIENSCIPDNNFSDVQ